METQRNWTASQIAGAMRITDRAVRLRSQQEGWPYAARPVRGGHQKLYAHAGLPQDVQAALLKTHAPAPPPAARRPHGDALHLVYDRKGERQKATAAVRLEALLSLRALVADGRPVVAARELVARTHGCTALSLWRWERMVSGLPPGDWLAALAPSYTGRTSTTEMDERAWDYLKADYLRLEQPTLSACYARLSTVAAREGWAIPSERTVARKIAREIPKTTLVLAREGETALARLYPAQERDKRSLAALEWVNGDGYKHNVFVRWPGIDKPVRPKTWVWQDVHSGKILAYRIDLSENTDTIRLSFLDLVDAWGLPGHVLIDNTTAAANKWMTGGVQNRFRFKVKAEDPLGVFPGLGISVHWAMPGWGQSKPVERAFGLGGVGEHVDKHPALAGAWCGNNTNAKPENYASTAAPLEEFRRAMAQGVALWNSLPARRTEVCGGVMSFDTAFAASYRRVVVTKPTPGQRAMLMLAAEAVKVKKDGTFKLQAGRGFGLGANRYGAEKLINFGGQKILVRFDPQNLHAPAYCYHLSGKSMDICADVIFAAGFGDTQAGREHNRARNQFKRARKDAAAALQRMDALEAARMLPEAGEPARPEARVVGVDFGRMARAAGQDFEPDGIDVDAAFAAGVAKLKR